MHEPFHRLKFAFLASYYDQIRAGCRGAKETGAKKVCALYQDASTDLIHKLGGKAMDGFYAAHATAHPYLDEAGRWKVVSDDVRPQP